MMVGKRVSAHYDRAFRGLALIYGASASQETVSSGMLAFSCGQ